MYFTKIRSYCVNAMEFISKSQRKRIKKEELKVLRLKRKRDEKRNSTIDYKLNSYVSDYYFEDHFRKVVLYIL